MHVPISLGEGEFVDTIASVIEPLRGIDWEDLDAVEQTSRLALDQMWANREIVRTALDAVADTPELLALCERPDPVTLGEVGQSLDKIVLYADPESGVRVRLHVFWNGCYDLPHNHRWTFASMVLKGHFRHFMYGDQGDDDAAFPLPFTALHARQERQGTTYALHHRMMHALVAEENTVSLVIRGPAVKDYSFLVDTKTGERVYHFGADKESPEKEARKKMTPETLRDLAAKFSEWGLF